MLRIKRFVIAIALCLGMLSCYAPYLSSQEPVDNVAPQADRPLSLAIQMRSVIESVLKHHREPPARQQMILAVLRSVAEDVESTSVDLAETVSDVLDSQKLYEMLNLEFERRAINENPPADVVARIQQGLSNAVPGGILFVTQEQHRIDEQFSSNRYVGIGVALRADKGAHSFASVVEGGAAAYAGIVAKDLLEQVDGKSTQDAKMDSVVSWLRGPEGTLVKIVVRTPGQEAREIEIVRGVVPFKHVFLEPQKSSEEVAYLRIERISASCVHEIRKIIDGLPECVTTLVFDLRSVREEKIHHLHLFIDSLLNQAAIGSVWTRKGVRPLVTEDGTICGRLRPIIVYPPRVAEYLDWLAEVFEHQQLDVYYDSLYSFHRKIDANDRDLIHDVVAMDSNGSLIEIACSRLHGVRLPNEKKGRFAGKPLKHAMDDSNETRNWNPLNIDEIVAWILKDLEKNRVEKTTVSRIDY